MLVDHDSLRARLLPLLLLRRRRWSCSHIHVSHLHPKWPLYVWIVTPRRAKRHHPVPILSVLVGILGCLIALLISLSCWGCHTRPLNLYILVPRCLIIRRTSELALLRVLSVLRGASTGVIRRHIPAREVWIGSLSILISYREFLFFPCCYINRLLLHLNSLHLYSRW
jgi:hypothetical protein